MRGTLSVLFVVLGFFLSVWAEEGSIVGREVVARTPQDSEDSDDPLEPPNRPGKGPPTRSTSSLSSTIPLLVTRTITSEVTVIISRTGTAFSTTSPSPITSSILRISSQAELISQTVPLSSFTQTTSTPTPASSIISNSPVSDNFNSSMENSSSSSASAPHQTLVIVLSTILGSIGVILVVLVLFLACRFKKRKAFKRRGVSPINDEEIESWRNKERKQPLSSPSRGLITTVSGGRISPDWTWMSPSNVQSPPRALTRGPSLLAKAPNARVGLTTENVPGEEPYIPIVKRQSSRLSKSQPRHIRTKSMRSSTSARSMRSMNGGSVGVIDFTLSAEGVPSWHNSENRRVESHSFSGLGTSSPATSVYVGSNEAGGLSPRPKSRQWEKSPSQPSDTPDWPISWN